MTPQHPHPLRLAHPTPHRLVRARAKTLFIVESPTKAAKVSAFLGKDYDVHASFGHFRQLPRRAGAVRPEDGFELDWEVMPGRREQLGRIEASAKSADALVLATDPDREGEAISWHMLEYLRDRGALQSGCKVERVTFSAVTEAAVREAMAAPRDISDDLVAAYLARLSMDYLLGFTLSPVLWTKLPGAKSAGRVQSPALRLLCQRELQRDLFRAEEYHTVSAALQAGAAQVSAELIEADGVKVAPTPEQGLTSERSHEITERLERAGAAALDSLALTKQKRAAVPPYRTSTLQQDAARLLGFSAKRTMGTAQQLFEEGLITYHRTDGLDISDERAAAIRTAVSAGPHAAALAREVRKFKTKAKNAQEAHEAVVATDPELRPEMGLAGDRGQRMLYELVWRRTLACQMTDAQFSRARALFAVDGCVLRANGRVLESPGFLSVWADAATIRSRHAEGPGATDSDDEPAGAAASGAAAGSGEDDEASDAVPTDRAASAYAALAALQKGDAAAVVAAEARAHETSPPGRFSEGSLVKALEDLGIGRPSTYASIIGTLIDRGYVSKQGASLVPSSTGRLLAAFLEAYFSQWVDYGFSGGMEATLDDISAGERETDGALQAFWKLLSSDVAAIKDVPVQDTLKAVEARLEAIAFPPTEDGADPHACPACGTGRLYLRISAAHGAFVACSNYKDRPTEPCTYRRPMLPQDGDISVEEAMSGLLLGSDPESGSTVRLMRGPYGRYVERSDEKGGRERKALPAALAAETLTLEEALSVLNAKDEVLGAAPGCEAEVLVKEGRFGPYYALGKLNASFGKTAEGFAPNMEHAMKRLEAKAAKLGVSLETAAQQGGSTRKAAAKKKPAAAKKAPKAKAKAKKPAATKGRRAAARTGGGDAKAAASAKDGASTGRAHGTKAYHAWVAKRRETAGESLQAARAAYSALPEADRASWKEEWLSGQAVAAP